MKGLQWYLPLEAKFLFTSYAGQMAAAITAKISVGSMVLLCHTGKETMVFLICEE